MGRARPRRGIPLPVRLLMERMKKSVYLKITRRARLMNAEEATVILAAFRFPRSKKRPTSFPWKKSTSVEKGGARYTQAPPIHRRSGSL